jgi:hypothetical protein
MSYLSWNVIILIINANLRTDLHRGEQNDFHVAHFHFPPVQLQSNRLRCTGALECLRTIRCFAKNDWMSRRNQSFLKTYQRSQIWMEQNVPVIVYDERVTVNTKLRQQKETDVFFQKKIFQFIYLV